MSALNSLVEEEKNGLKVLPGDDLAGGAAGNDLSGDEADSFSDPWGLVESGIFGDLVDGIAVDNSGDEEDLDGAHRSSEALLHPAFNHISFARRGRLGVGVAMAEEFETPAEQAAYLLILEQVRNCFKDEATKQQRDQALEWVFTYLPDKFGRTFRLACDVLRVRPNLLRTRVQFQFYKKGMIFEERLPVLCVDMPDLIQAEAAYYSGDAGTIAANIAWFKPGVSHRELAVDKQTVLALQLLEERGLMSEHGGCWYTTGRNPLLREKARQHISWSSLWPRSEVF